MSKLWSIDAVKRKVKEAGAETDLDARADLDHHPKALEIADAIHALDWIYGDDALSLKFGGDGDNGEHLLMLLDIAVEAGLIK